MKNHQLVAIALMLAGAGYSQLLSGGSAVSKPLTYRSSIEAVSAHPDTNPPSKLLDGRYTTASSASVEYWGDPEIEFTFGSKTRVEQVKVVCFNLNNAKIGHIAVDVSEDGQTWIPAGKVTEIAASLKASDPGATLSFNVGREIRKFKVTAVRAEGSKRVLLGEVIVVR